MSNVIKLLGKGKAAVADALGDFFYLLAFTIKSHGARERKELTPDEVMNEFLSDNRVVSSVRRWLIKWGIMRDPQGVPHPDRLVVACMDGRIQMHAVVGSLKLNMDCLRLPGSVTTELAMVESIAVSINEHKVKFVAILRHTDCAMEKIKADPNSPGQRRYGCLVNALSKGDRFLELLKEHNQEAYERFAQGKVKIGQGILDTRDNLVMDWTEYQPLGQVAELPELEELQTVNA